MPAAFIATLALLAPGAQAQSPQPTDVLIPGLSEEFVDWGERSCGSTAVVQSLELACGLLLYAQAAYFDPTATPRLRLTNAIDILVGL